MPSSAELNRQKFAETFNRLLGDKTGKPIKYYSDAQLQNSISDSDRRKASLNLAKPEKVKAAPKAKVKITPAVGTLSVSDLLNSDKKAKETGQKITLPLPPTATSKKALDQGKAADFIHSLSSGGIPSFHEAINSVKRGLGNAADYVGIIDRDNPDASLGATGEYLNTGAPAQAMLKGVSKVTDVAERPIYAINEASREFGKDPSLGGLAHGANEGITGRAKTGFGEVIEATPASHLNPWIKRGIGLGGDIFLDPLTYVGGGSTLAGKEATNAGLRAGIEATGKDALKEEFGKIVKNVITDSGESSLKKVKPSFTKGVKGTTAEERIVARAKEKLDNMVFEEKSGKMIGGKAADTHGTFSSAAGEAVREEMISSVKNARNKFVAGVKAGKKYTTAEFAKMREDPLFSEWLDAAEEVKNERLKRKLPQRPRDYDKIATAIDEKFSGKLSPRVDAIKAKVLGELDDAVMRIPKISFAKHDLYLPKVARAMKELKSVIPENSMITSGAHNFKKAFLMSSWLPGYTSHISQKMKSINKLAFDEFKTNIEELFRGTTVPERRTIHEAIEQGRDLTGSLGDIQKEVKRHYKDMFYDEIKSGTRNEVSTPYAPNYVFNRIKGGEGNLPHDFDTDWRKPRKAAIKANKGDVSGFTAVEAKEKGLRVNQDAAEALIDRKMRSLNKQSKSFLSKDLATHYGIVSSVPMDQALSKDLVRLDVKTHPWLKSELKPGQQMYLHKDINDVLENYNELMGFNRGKKAGNLEKTYMELTKIFKQSNTIYWPGFHIRNMLSDAWMGAIDGVKAKEYPEIFEKMFHRDTAKINIGGETVPFNKLYDSYVENASSGFYDAEMNIRTPKTDLKTTEFMDKMRPGHVTSTLRDLSQKREDLGRLVHYYHAMDEEYAHQIAKGVSKETAWKNAEEAAISRVNRFKFDYSALTPFEQKIRKYGIPFYTYMRKATPVLLENLLMKPKYFAYINKLQKALAPTDQFKADREPSWMVGQNFSQLTDDSQPWGFTDSLFPTRTLEDALTRNPVEIANPLIQAGFELKSGKDTFTGKPVHNLGDILKNKFKGTTQWESAMAPTDPTVKGSKPTLEKWATALGIPLYKVTAARQEGKQNELEFKLKEKVKDYNKQIEDQGYKISVRHGVIYLIEPKTDTTKEKIVGQYERFSDIPLKLH